MNRRNNSTLLLPLMAILALAYPVAIGPRQSSPSVSTGSKVLHFAAPEKEKPAAAGSPASAQPKLVAPHNAKKILSEFVGAPPDKQQLYHYPLQSPGDTRYEVDFLIATIPDPIDSRLPYLFDRNLSSIERAVEADNYVLDRFDLPWLEELRERQAAKDAGKKTAANENDGGQSSHSFEQDPGLVLFRDPEPVASPNGGPPTAHALLLFLVGETPTSGIHKEAMLSALDQIDEFCSSQGSAGVATTPQNVLTHDGSRCETIKILGPSFSGSAESLDFALHLWLKSHLKARFRIVSGTATAIRFDSDPPAGCYSHFQLPHEIDHPAFASAVVRDILALNELLRYLQSKGNPQGLRVALLTEGNTAYGSSLSGAIRPKTVAKCSTQIVQSVTNLPFPLHISRLRSELERARQERQQSSQQQTPNQEFSQTLPLPTEDDSEDAKDSIAPASQLDISSSELMLSNLLSTISREQINYVGIAATDVRDVIFLAREIREHSPSTVIFTLNGDLLFAHPEANPNTRGMLVVTPYPLFPLNQLWMSPTDPDNPDKTGSRRILFPDQGSEGVYNAMLSLLGNDAELLEYGSPFKSWIAGDPKVPPLWIVAVGRDGFWPVAIRPKAACDADTSHHTVEAESAAPSIAAQDNRGVVPPAIRSEPACDAGATHYTLEAKSATPSIAAQNNHGIVPQFTLAVLILWGLLCLVPGLIFLACDAERWIGWKFVKWMANWLRSRSPLSEFFAFEGLEAKSFHLIGGSAALSIYAVAIAAYFVSAIQRQEPSRKFFLFVMLLVLMVGAAACLSLAVDIIRQACHGSEQRAKCESDTGGRCLGTVIPALVSSFIFWALAGCLAGRWVYLRIYDKGNGIITGFRAVNLHNGVSPLPPLFFIALAAVFWVLCSIRRFHLDREIPSVLPPSTSGLTHHPVQYDENSLFFYSDKSSFCGSRVLERRVREFLACSSLQFPCGSRVAAILTLSLTLFWGGYLFFYRLVYAFESRFFYWLLGGTFLLVYAAVLTNVLRLFFLWSALSALLERLDRHPMRDAFSRFHRAHRTMPRMSLAAAPTALTALGFSVAQAGDLLTALQQLPGAKNAEVANIIDEGKERVRIAETHYADALQQEALGRYQLSLNAQKDAQIALNSFTRIVEGVLELSWKSSISVAENKENGKGLPEVLWHWFVSSFKPTENLEEARRAITNQGEEFIVSRTVHFLAQIFPQLTNLASYSLLCLFLMLLAVGSYPLQPRNPFFFFNWFVILAFIGVCVYIAFQMNRDVVLSGLNGTKPGEIHWDTEFIGRIVFFIVLPLLGLLGVQFPDTLGQFLRLLAPAGSGHP
jgi:hypothetical protein